MKEDVLKVDNDEFLKLLDEALTRWEIAVIESSLAPTTKATYLQHTDRFVEWLKGRYILPRGGEWPGDST